MKAGDFYEMVMRQKEPYWLSFECPQCSGELQSVTICDHGEMYSCKGCSFKSYVEFQGVEECCVKCSLYFD